MLTTIDTSVSKAKRYFFKLQAAYIFKWFSCSQAATVQAPEKKYLPTFKVTLRDNITYFCCITLKANSQKKCGNLFIFKVILYLY